MMEEATRADVELLRRAGLLADYQAVRAAVDRHLPPANYTNSNIRADAATQRRLRVEQVTQLLVSTLAYRAADVATPQQAKRLVELATTPFGDSKSQAAQLSHTALLAEFVEVSTEPGPLGTRRFSTIRYRVVEPLKNAPPAGTLIRTPGGPTINPDGTSSVSTADLESVRPGRYILYLSQRSMVAKSPTPIPVDLYARTFGPLREFDDSFIPVGESSHPEVTLDDIRAAIREQLCLEDHVLAATGDSPPQPC